MLETHVKEDDAELQMPKIILWHVATVGLIRQTI